MCVFVSLCVTKITVPYTFHSITSQHPFVNLMNGYKPIDTVMLFWDGVFVCACVREGGREKERERGREREREDVSGGCQWM